MEVSETVGTALDELRLAMEALGDAIVLGKPPRAGDFLLPASENLGEGDSRTYSAVSELANDFHHSREQNPACIKSQAKGVS